MPTDRNLKVSLGCGTLILITLIVLIFGNVTANRLGDGIEKLDAKFQMLDQRCANIELLLSIQKGEIEELQGLIETLLQELGQAPQKPGEELEPVSPPGQAI